MRKLIVCFALLLGGNQVEADDLIPVRTPKLEFDLDESATKATHILVVDALGQVLEVWKGKAQPGDIVPIEKLLSPVFHVHGQAKIPSKEYLYDACPQRQRIILFLIKTPAPTPGAVLTERVMSYNGNQWQWICREIQEEERSGRKGIAEAGVTRVNSLVRGMFSQDGWLPASPTGHVACSIAYVDDLGLVHARKLKPAAPIFHRHYYDLSDVSGEPKGPLLEPIWEIVGIEIDFKHKVENAIKGTHRVGLD